ncbi:carbohydrate-binding family 9-like protein [Antarcticibacterium sp. 1MA-6-2]|uniref:carbohydrate-binding family 9-like protein n=1 Tax=Antarcticibacterium sp. 1MA-6-2 TaxID=2908210 RepID=UPI001F3D7A53|nr:carbohydrate-binding family 9-like protein [Antarcticibacterium sp. 1MA-6-2]UJH90725.1 carbohydrate-binding family 9-like protein [Antarcticibacterium sp. 1MA-6-2]
MKIFSAIFGYLFFLNCFAQDPPRVYVAHKASENIDIDGRADEKDWKEALWTADFIDIEGQKIPKYKTNVKMLWDEKYFYVYAKMEEPHIWATLKQRDTVIFYNNDFEVFIDPDGDAQKYMEFEMNALNTVWDLMLVEAYREGGNAIDSWNIVGVKSAVNIEGTLNNSGDIDEYWEVEIAMPWSVLTEAGNSSKTPVNDFWRVNFSRVNWDHHISKGRYSRKKAEDGNFLPEYNWVWSPQGVINMHEPEHWGYVYFSDNNPSKNFTFSLPKDEHIRWKMYELYRAQKKYFEKHQKWARSIEKIELEPISILGAPVHPEIEIHSAGYNIVIESPFTGIKYLINNNGKFIQLSN